jgi:signal transduction histidine kinase
MFGVTCAFHCPRPVLLEDHAAATHLFRIVQESVSNAIRHGKASHLQIQLARGRERVTVAVTDNGSGFPKALPKEPGMGLRIMQSRATMIGGALSFGNQPGGGAKVICSVALKPAIQQNAPRRARQKEKSDREKEDTDR